MEVIKKQLILGYQYVYDKNKNTASICFDNGIYQVKGFVDNLYFWEDFDKFKDAKRFFKHKTK